MFKKEEYMRYGIWLAYVKNPNQRIAKLMKNGEMEYVAYASFLPVVSPYLSN